MSGIQQLLTLPAELQVLVYSYLSPNDLNAWRLASNERKGFIDATEGLLYQSRLVEINMETELMDGAQMIWLNLHHKFVVVLLTLVNNICADIAVTNQNTHYAARMRTNQGGGFLETMRICFLKTSFSRVYDANETLLSTDEWKKEAMTKFLYKSFEECMEIILKKSGGVSPLTLTGRFLLEFAQNYRMILNVTQELKFCSSRFGIPKEVLWDTVFAQKKPLYITEIAFLDGHRYESLMDDRFARDAAKGGLRIEGGNPFRMTDEQFLTIVGRKDLNLLELCYVTSLSVEGLRAVIQILLNSTMECVIRSWDHVSRSDDHCRKILMEKGGYELIEPIPSVTFESFTIRYQMNARIVYFGSKGDEYMISAK